MYYINTFISGGNSNDRYQNDNNYRNDDNRDEGRRGRGRGNFDCRVFNTIYDYIYIFLGGRGGGRGGGRSYNNDDGDTYKESKCSIFYVFAVMSKVCCSLSSFFLDGGEEAPKKEYYIPVERTTDEDLFTTGISTGINFMKLQDVEVNVSGENVPTPITSFDSCGLRSHLVENIKKSKYTDPTPIQKYSIPTILSGRDLMGCAQTGSGKTVRISI